MGRPLDEYRRKRDFDKTPEPRASERSGPDARVFVVHRHDASRLHYDLRLEMQGVLRSWAVPKGFSYDPDAKHLAVRTEDHPLAYEHFDGVIPAGEYGAGTMTVWDRGRYELLAGSDPAAVADGELKLVLHGRRLRGEWHLVQTRQEQGRHWLLFKSRDRYAGSSRNAALLLDLARARQAPLPRSLRRMQAADETTPFSDPAWLFEMEFAGRRVLAEKRGDAVRLRGFPLTPPEVAADLAELGAETALLEGVLVVLDEQQRPSRELLAARLAGRSDAPLCLYAFDLLYLDEFDLRPMPLIERKTALRVVLPAGSRLLYIDPVPGDGERLAEVVAATGLPGVLAKRADAAYHGGPSPDWRVVPATLVAAPAGSVSAALESRRGDGGRSRVRLTHLEKVYWPAEGYTKGDLVAWYEQVAPFLLPYLADRPVHMNRFPDGIEGKSFYQRHVNATIAEWIPRVMIAGERDGERDVDDDGEPRQYVVCSDRDALLALANLGSIDLHPWLSRHATPYAPDWAVLDLDPKQAPFGDVVTIARCLGSLLHELGLRPCLKTSGSTGLHIYLPLVPGYTYEQVRLFCEGVARVVCRELPDLATIERSPGRRGGRVYIDFLQNGQGQTVVPPYVVRPVPGARVSTPLHWHELVDDLSLDSFTIRTVMGRLAAHGDLFRGTLDDPQDLLGAAEALQGRMARRRKGG